MDGVTSYKKYYDECLEMGKEFQDFISVLLLKEIGISLSGMSSKKYQTSVGENLQGIEIKFDNKFKLTNNVYIEVKEKSDPNNAVYVDSGIYRKDNTWIYIIGDYNTVFIFGKEHLKLMHKSNKYHQVTTPTSVGFLVPLSDAKKYSLKLLIL